MTAHNRKALRAVKVAEKRQVEQRTIKLMSERRALDELEQDRVRVGRMIDESATTIAICSAATDTTWHTAALDRLRNELVAIDENIARRRRALGLDPRPAA